MPPESRLVNGRVNADAKFSRCGASPLQACSSGSSILRTLAGHNLLFSQSTQAVYELDEFSAYVWRSLDEGATPTRIIAELIEAGVAATEALHAVTASMGRLQPFLSDEAQDGPLESAANERLTSLKLEIAGVAVQIHLPEVLRPDVLRLFGHMISDSPSSDLQLCARLDHDEVEILPPGAPAWRCKLAEFIPTLKAELLERVLQCARYEVALHAAALVSQEEALLILGSPGAGKTTLAIALAHAGLQLQADDVVLMHQDGAVTGIAFPFAAKAGCWPLIAQHWPNTVTGPEYRRPDGQRVRYLLVGAVAAPRRRRIGAVVLLDRQDGAETRIEEIDPNCALAALIAEGDARDQRLSAAGFAALISALRDARCCRLTYCDVVEASQKLRDLCS